MITQKEVRQLFTYCPLTGIFLSNQPTMARMGGIEKKGYRVITIQGKKYKAHRLAWLYIYGYLPKKQIDHINHIRDDNRIENLREVSNYENQKNATKRKDNKSGQTGVYWSIDAKKWRAQINVDGIRVNLGVFAEFSEAVNVRKLAEVAYGYHENHGKG